MITSYFFAPTMKPKLLIFRRYSSITGFFPVISFAMSLSAFVGCPQAFAAQTSWTNGTANNNWFVAGNWSAGVPIAANDAAITTGATNVNPVTLGAVGAVANKVQLDDGNVLNVTGAGTTLVVSDLISVGQTTGSLSTLQIVNGATVTTNRAFAGDGPATGQILVSGAGSTLTVAMTGGSARTVIGGMSAGLLRVDSGATVNINGSGLLEIGNGPISGTLQIGNGGAGGTVNASTIQLSTAGSQIIFNNTDTSTLAGIITGSGSLTKNLAGTAVLTGTSTFTGGTIVAGGVLSLTGNNLANASTVTVASGATLNLTGADTIGTLNSNGTISGAGILTATTYNLNTGTSVTGHLGLGTLNSNGAVGITGLADALGVNVQTGTLTLSGNNLADASTVAVSSGATLNVAGADTIGTLNSNGTISGAGVLTATTYNLDAGTSVTGHLGNGSIITHGAVEITGTTGTGSLNVTSGTLTFSGTSLNEIVDIADGASLIDSGNLADTTTVTNAGLFTVNANDTILNYTQNGNAFLAGSATLTATGLTTLNGGTISGHLLSNTTSTNNVSVSGSIGGGSLDITAGTLNLTGSLNSSVVNIASGSTLQNNNGGLSATSTINNSGTLTINNINESVYALNNHGVIKVDSAVFQNSDTNFFANTIHLEYGSTLVLANSTLQVGQSADIFDGSFDLALESRFTSIQGSGLRYGIDYSTGKVHALPGIPNLVKSTDTMYNFTKNQTFVVGSAFEDSFTGGPNDRNFFRHYYDNFTPAKLELLTGTSAYYIWDMDPGTGFKPAVLNTDLALLEEAIKDIQEEYYTDTPTLNNLVRQQGLAIANKLSPEVHRGMVDYTEQTLRTHVREGVDGAPVSRSGQTQVFAAVHTTSAGAEDAVNNASYDTEMNGVTAGVRYDIDKRLQIGGLIGADDGSIKGALIDTDAQGMMFGAFGHYIMQEASKTTLTGSLAYGTFDFDSSRQSYGGLAKASGIGSDAFECAIGVRTVSFEKDGFKMLPNATLRYLNGSVDGFEEDSGNGVKLAVDSQSVSSLLLDLGVDFEYQLQEHFTLVGKVSYVTDFQDSDNNMTARFAASGADARTFSVTSPGIDDEGLVLALGAYYDINDSARLGLSYRSELRKNSETSQTIGLSASFGF